MSNILINFAIGSYADPTAMPPDQAKIIGISRHRLSTDGDGVTTLVAFQGCSYSLNPKSYKCCKL
ncbi:hypothetical protein [Bacteroides acidifaciens]|uniref:hypothetical protein n=1 Tax=Bacteroides acidifaciens TaxID=85831 RepID=UPI0025A519EC|nr:hypothetical protein [Bacteroides acidifaciens]